MASSKLTRRQRDRLIELLPSTANDELAEQFKITPQRVHQIRTAVSTPWMKTLYLQLLCLRRAERRARAAARRTKQRHARWQAWQVDVRRWTRRRQTLARMWAAGCSMTEIARRLGMSKTAVGVRIHHCRHSGLAHLFPLRHHPRSKAA